MSEFAIYEIAAGRGRLALSQMPGRRGSYGADLGQIRSWGAGLVVTLTTQGELEGCGAGNLGADLTAFGIAWRHLPINDFGVMSGAVETQWAETAAFARGLLGQGQRVLVHCWGGCGRSGMVALRLLIGLGEAPDAALARLRGIRSCAIETADQMAWAIKV